MVVMVLSMVARALILRVVISRRHSVAEREVGGARLPLADH